MEDIAKLYQALYRFRYLSTEDIVQYLFDGREMKAKRLLKKLRDEGMLVAFKLPKRKGQGYLYSMTPKALGFFLDIHPQEVEKWQFHLEYKNNITHYLVLNRVLLAYERVGDTEANSVETYTQRETQHHYGEKYSEKLCPDGAIYHDGVVYFLEYENESKVASIHKKVKNYAKYWLSRQVHEHTSIPGIREFKVLMIYNSALKLERAKQKMLSGDHIINFDMKFIDVETLQGHNTFEFLESLPAIRT